ncbi:zinc finger MYM-type protein 1-like [Aphis craccivora]|uniref:Zinc finger MYM-type protein 1-like n=1 Tax=Aphis craccivora TaxID=307492 RepID=A0A6G0VJU0_APHCR|nr:zinc finger MYM-type protein 1-like [Aphis craccivora]
MKQNNNCNNRLTEIIEQPWHSIQAEIIQIMTNMILNKITSEVKESVYLSVMADETKDISKTEQFSVVVRNYFQGELKEHFLGFTPLTDLDSTSLFLIKY